MALRVRRSDGVDDQAREAFAGGAGRGRNKVVHRSSSWTGRAGLLFGPEREQQIPEPASETGSALWSRTLARNAGRHQQLGVVVARLAVMDDQANRARSRRLQRRASRSRAVRGDRRSGGGRGAGGSAEAARLG